MRIARHVLESEGAVTGRITSDDGCVLVEEGCIYLSVVALVCTSIQFIAIISYYSIGSVNAVVWCIVPPGEQYMTDAVFFIKAGCVLPFIQSGETAADPFAVSFGMFGHEMIDGGTVCRLRIEPYELLVIAFGCEDANAPEKLVPTLRSLLKDSQINPQKPIKKSQKKAIPPSFTIRSVTASAPSRSFRFHKRSMIAEPCRRYADITRTAR